MNGRKFSGLASYTTRFPTNCPPHRGPSSQLDENESECVFFWSLLWYSKGALPHGQLKEGAGGGEGKVSVRKFQLLAVLGHVLG